MSDVLADHIIYAMMDVGRLAVGGVGGHPDVERRRIP
jgi:hypothetical protein